MESNQQQYLKQIEAVLPKNESLVNVLADVLGLSNDSVYRRLRDETALTIDEIVTLSNHFKVSLNTIHSGLEERGVVTFQYTKLKKDEKYFRNYLDALLADIQQIRRSNQRQITYACEDIPVFHNFRYPILASFKMFYWMNAVMNVPFLQGEKFDSSKIADEFKEMGHNIYKHYSNVPVIEIWTDSTVLGVIKQIEYFWDSGKFKSLKDALEVSNALKTLLEDIESQAAKEYRSEISPEEPKEKNFVVYSSEMEITNNCVLINLGESDRVYLGHQSFNTIVTNNSQYAKETEEWFEVMLKKATLISGVAEKHRYQFFRRAIRHVDKLIERLKDDY